MFLSDMHFHLDGYRNHKQIYDEINNLKQYTLCVTNSPQIFAACRSTYQETSYVRFALGSHPLVSKKDFDYDYFAEIAKQTKYIGEIGLDFSKATETNKQTQINHFNKLLEMIKNYNKVISIHSTNAEQEIFDSIVGYTNHKYVMHWFCGDTKQLERFVALGCFFSININQLKNHSELVKSIPKELILIESDGPRGSYLNGKYSPTKLNEIYSTISRLFGFDIRDQVYKNLERLLSFV